MWPVFLPFAGCPARCVYCAQNRQTGLDAIDLEEEFVKLEQGLAERDSAGRPPIGLGFFGGTFTALPESRQDRFLKLGLRFKERGSVSHIRCSTRPDCVSAHLLEKLKDRGLDMVELGVQSFSDRVLREARRGYAPETVLAAAGMVREAGLELGIQLLPGLPGHGGGQWDADVVQTIALRPAVLRIYPCLVIDNTVLAGWWRRGSYHPWTLPESVERIGRALPMFWKADISVIRIGLAPEPALMRDMLAGPWHPALGTLVRGRALVEILKERLGAGLGPGQQLFVPGRYSGEFWGHKGANREELAALGVEKEMVRFWDEAWFEVKEMKQFKQSTHE